jgi:archaemetzincin
MILLVPLHTEKKEIEELLQRCLNSLFSEEVRIINLSYSDSQRILTNSYSKARLQINAPKLLAYLRNLKNNLNLVTYSTTQNCHLLGIVEQDLYSPPFYFILGQADMRNSVAVISLFRLKFIPSMPNILVARQTFLARTFKEALHELGHTHKLRHCKDKSCVMYFSRSLADTDRKEQRFCKNCLRKLNIFQSTIGR